MFFKLGHLNKTILLLFLNLNTGSALAQTAALAGDVNHDGIITPADALCVFQKFLGLPSCLDSGIQIGSLVDDYAGNNLNTRLWNVINGSPQVNGGILVLAGGSTRCEIQSTMSFSPGAVMQMKITSSDWKPQGTFTDSSFGFEIFAGANGDCHYGVLMNGSGHLGLLRPEPDGNGNCFGDPKFQDYPPLPSWDTIRANQTITMMIAWTTSGVTLQVSGANDSSATVIHNVPMAIPNVPLLIRLNADRNETYAVEYVYAMALPKP